MGPPGVFTSSAEYKSFRASVIFKSETFDHNDTQFRYL